jgi:hypothetical protein
LEKPFELNYVDYDVESATIRHGRSGATFRCTLKGVTDEMLEALNDAVQSRRMIRFPFPRRPLVLEKIEVVSLGPGRIRISGRVLDPD